MWNNWSWWDTINCTCIYAEWPKKCIHSLLINIFGINLNEISISGWECNIMYSVYTLKDISASQERLCHLLSKNYNSACAIYWENIILHSHPEIEISFKFIPKILMSKSVYIFLGHSVCLGQNFSNNDRIAFNPHFILDLFTELPQNCTNSVLHACNLVIIIHITTRFSHILSWNDA